MHSLSCRITEALAWTNDVALDIIRRLHKHLACIFFSSLFWRNKAPLEEDVEFRKMVVIVNTFLGQVNIFNLHGTILCIYFS